MKYFPGELADRLRAEGDGVVEYLKSLTPDQWDRDIYTEDHVWRVRDLLAHFIAAEQGFQQLIQNVVTGGPGASVDFDINEYNKRTVSELRHNEADVLLGQYAMVRERTAAMVNELETKHMDMTGQHPFIGQAPLEDMIRAIYHHNSLHLRDVRKALRSNPGSAMKANPI